MTHWLKQNLFRTWFDGLVTVVLIALLAWAAVAVFQWAVLDADWSADSLEDCKNASQRKGACWAVFKGQFAKFFFGFYPAEHYWRPILAVCLLPLALAPIFLRGLRRFTIWISILYPFFVYALVIGAAGLGYFPITKVGGFALTFFLGVTGSLIAIGFAIVFALIARFGILPIRWLCRGIVGFLNGIPVYILLIASYVLSLYFLPPPFWPNYFHNTIWALGLASAAKISIGLGAQMEAVSKHSNDAAYALGFSKMRTFWLIVFPAGFQNNIPYMLDAIAELFRNTAVVSLLGLLSPLAVALNIRATPEWNGVHLELYIVIGALHWVISFALTSFARVYRRALARKRVQFSEPYFI